MDGGLKRRRVERMLSRWMNSKREKEEERQR